MTMTMNYSDVHTRPTEQWALLLPLAIRRTSPIHVGQHVRRPSYDETDSVARQRLYLQWYVKFIVCKHRPLHVSSWRTLYHTSNSQFSINQLLAHNSTLVIAVAEQSGRSAIMLVSNYCTYYVVGLGWHLAVISVRLVSSYYWHA